MGILTSLYAFLGPDRQQKSKAIKRLHQTYSEAELQHYSMLQDEIEALIDCLYHPPLYALHRVITVSHSEMITNKKHLTALTTYCKQSNEDTILVFMSDTLQLPNLLTQCIPKKNQQIFWEKHIDQRVSWLMSQSAQSNCTLTRDAAVFLARMTGGLQKDLTETLHLIVSLGKKNITIEDVRNLPVHVKHETVFSLIDACCLHDSKTAIHILHQLLNSNESPVSIIVRLQLYFRKIHTIAENVASGVSFEEACSKIGIFGKKAMKSVSQCVKNHSLKDITTILATLYQTDVYLRSYPEITHRTILDLCMLHMINNQSWSTENFLSPNRMTSQW